MAEGLRRIDRSQAGPHRYGIREAAELLELPEARIRAYVKGGFLRPERGPRGEIVLSFQDLAFLRTAKRLAEARVPERRVRRALLRLKAELPEKPLSGICLDVAGDDLVVRDGDHLFCAETGQRLFSFEEDAAPEGQITSLVARQQLAEAAAEPTAGGLSADEWYDRGCELEETSPDKALGAYRRALALDPRHADARINLGRLFHEAGDLATAEGHYRMALSVRPDDSTAAYNLGVVLEDMGRLDEALSAYRAAAELDPLHADAHYNLARLYEQTGDETSALRHLRIYRKLTLGR